MFFSIIVTVYNAEKYLDKCIQSILNQTESDFEIILVDDGSRDRSREICDTYAYEFPDLIHVFHTQNQGALLSRRHGMKAATGKFIWNIDSDDYIPDIDALSFLKFHILKSDCDFVFFGFLGDNQKSYTYNRYFSDNQMFVDDEEKMRIYDLVINTFSFNSLWNKVFARNIVDLDADYSNFTNIINGNDFFQLLPIITNARKILYLEKSLYFYRKTEGSIIHRFKPHIYEAIRANCLRLNSFFPLWNMSVHSDNVNRRHLIYIIAAINKVRLIPYRDKFKIGLPFLKKIREDFFFLQIYNEVNINGLPILKRVVVFLLFHKMYLLLLLIP